MKPRMTFNEVCTKAEAEHEATENWLAATEHMTYSAAEDTLRLVTAETHKGSRMLELPMTDQAHKGLSQSFGIPARFYHRLREDYPKKLEQLLGMMFIREPKVRLIRTLNGKARAFLSDVYKPIDNHEVLERSMPFLDKMFGSDFEVLRSDLSAGKMELKIYSSSFEHEVRPGDTLRTGLTLRNSEVGTSSLTAIPALLRLVCTNGMMLGEVAGRYSTYHTMGKMPFDVTHGAVCHTATEIRRSLGNNSEKWWDSFMESMEMASDPERIVEVVDRFREATERELTDDDEQLAEVLQGDFKIAEVHSQGIIEELYASDDRTQWGLTNAVTSYAKEVESMNVSTELEEAGSTISFRSDSWFNSRLGQAAA